MSTSNDKTVFKTGLEAISKIAHPFKHVEEVDQAIEVSQSFLSGFESMISNAAALTDAESKQRLDKLLEAIKFSDPISVREAEQSESILLKMASEASEATKKGTPIPIDSISSMMRLLDTRNHICKKNK